MEVVEILKELSASASGDPATSTTDSGIWFE